MADNTAQDTHRVYSSLQVELLSGSSADTKEFTGLSTSTTVRSFRAVVAARIGRAPADVRLMAHGSLLDDCERYLTF
jgi:hypothetical protein